MGDRPLDEAADRPAPIDRPAVGVLSLAHLFVDLCQGVVAAMLPFLVAAAAASSVGRPIFGRLADRASVPGLLPASVLVTGLALATGSRALTYWAMVGLSGLGVA